MALRFDVKDLIGEVNDVVKTQIPRAANLALKRFGYVFKHELLPDEMNKSFTHPDGMGRPVPFTLNASLYDVEGMTITFKIKDEATKGTSPAEYLRSAVYGGEVTMTPLASAVKGITEMSGTPALGNLARLGALTDRLDIRPSYAAKIITGLEKNYVRKSQPRAGERFAFTTSANGFGRRGAGVYRIKGNSVARVLTLTQNKPTVEPTLRYEAFIEESARKQLPGLLDEALGKI